MMIGNKRSEVRYMDANLVNGCSMSRDPLLFLPPVMFFYPVAVIFDGMIGDDD